MILDHFFISGEHSSTQNTDKVWPPPQPPENLDKSSLPTNLRPSKLTSQNTENTAGTGDRKHEQTITHQERNTNEKSNDGEKRVYAPSGDTHRTPDAKGERPPSSHGSGNRSGDETPSENSLQQTREVTTVHMDNDEATGDASHCERLADIEERFPMDVVVTEDPVVIEFHDYGRHGDSPKGPKRQRLNSEGKAQDRPYEKRPIIFHGIYDSHNRLYIYCTPAYKLEKQFLC